MKRVSRIWTPLPGFIGKTKNKTADTSTNQRILLLLLPTTRTTGRKGPRMAAIAIAMTLGRSGMRRRSPGPCRISTERIIRSIRRGGTLRRWDLFLLLPPLLPQSFTEISSPKTLYWRNQSETNSDSNGRNTAKKKTANPVVLPRGRKRKNKNKRSVIRRKCTSQNLLPSSAISTTRSCGNGTPPASDRVPTTTARTSRAGGWDTNHWNTPPTDFHRWTNPSTSLESAACCTTSWWERIPISSIPRAAKQGPCGEGNSRPSRQCSPTTLARHTGETLPC
mmetsp:Transcript_22120/g.46555  ORF Transcript_22120/g.46555 Transcript_22120/m.46555 type:complete len:279 (-) Transcript_22120:550-1386(-)